MKKNGLKKIVFSSLVWKFGERLFAQLTSLVVSVILARVLSPDDYGTVALVMVFIYIADVFVSNGLGMALIQNKDADDLDFSSVFFMNLLISILIYLMLFSIAPFVARYYENDLLCHMLRVISLRIPIAAINSVQQAYVAKKMEFKKFFYSTFLGTFLSGVIGICMAYKGWGTWALVMQYLSNTYIDTFVLFITVRWTPKLEFSWNKAKGLISYGYKILVSGLISAGCDQLRSLIIGKRYTSTDLAYFKHGDRYPQLIIINLDDSISSVLYPALANYQDDRAKVRYMTRTAIQVSSYIVWPAMCGLAVVAKPLVILLLTEKWLPCVRFLQIFCFYYAFFPHASANLQAIKAMGRSDIFLKLQIAKYSISLIILFLTMQYGPLFIAAGMLMSCIISVFMNSYPNIKLLDYKLKEQLRDFFSAFFLAFIMAGTIFLLSLLPMNLEIVLTLQIIIGVILYAFISILFQPQGYVQIAEIFFDTEWGKTKMTKIKLLEQIYRRLNKDRGKMV